MSGRALNLSHCVAYSDESNHLPSPTQVARYDDTNTKNSSAYMQIVGSHTLILDQRKHYTTSGIYENHCFIYVSFCTILEISSIIQ